MRRHSFTLTELLVVIGIIIILAGLALPAIITAQRKGRVTAAKADMAAILTALKGVEGTYHKMVALTGGNAVFGAKSLSTSHSLQGDYSYVVLGDPSDEDSVDAYNYFMVELTNPKKYGSSDTLNINKRKMVFLDAKSEYDPAVGASLSDNITANQEHLWRDPWGNPYKLYLNTNFTDAIPHPGWSIGTDYHKFISGKAIMYSRGPNGTDDHGLNVVDDDASGDDICSWK